MDHAVGDKDVEFPVADVDGMTSGGGGAENGANTSSGSNEASAAADGAHQIDPHAQDVSAASVASAYSGSMQQQQSGRASGGGAVSAGYFQANGGGGSGGGSEPPNSATSTAAANSYPASYGNRALSQVRQSETDMCPGLNRFYL